MTVIEALQAVVKESSNEYAKTYAKAGLELGSVDHHLLIARDNVPSVEVYHELTGKMMIGEELKVQILYVLSNLSGWRGERAREVKAVLKKEVK